MDSTLSAVLIGGLIGTAGTLIGVLATHILESRRHLLQQRGQAHERLGRMAGQFIGDSVERQMFETWLELSQGFEGLPGAQSAVHVAFFAGWVEAASEHLGALRRDLKQTQREITELKREIGRVQDEKDALTQGEGGSGQAVTE